MTMFDKFNNVYSPRKERIQKRLVISIFGLILIGFMSYGVLTAGNVLGDWIADEFIVVSYHQKLNQ